MWWRLRLLRRPRSDALKGFRSITTPALGASQVAGKYLLGSALLAAGGAGAYVSHDDGIKRSLTFWRVVFPIYLHYLYTDYATRGAGAKERDAAFDELHVKYSPTVERVTTELRGFYLKQAQLMSIRDDFVPPQYLEWCKKMQDSAPVPLDEATARSILETSLGRRVEEVFSAFNWTPIGSASIGQVYRATLHNGRDVAVKVQVPGIEDSFRADLNTARAFCRLALPQFVKSLDETERQFLTEFDYTREANNLDVVADNIMPAWGDRVVVPRPVHGLCTRDVLVMDYLPGVKLVDGVRASYAQYAERTGTTLEDLERQELAMMQSADYRHRTLDDAARRTRLLWYYLRATDCAYNAARLVYNWTAGWVAAPRPYRWCDPPVNLAEVLRVCMAVHGYEIFIDGVFNGDPHPGNILLMPDGRVGLIDYGQVKRLTDDIRASFARLIIALWRDDRPEVVRIMQQELGAKSKHMNSEMHYKAAAMWFDRDTEDILGDRNIHQFLEYIEKEDPIETYHDDIVMVARCSIMMRSIALAFGIRMRTSEAWRQYAEQYLERRGIKY